MKTYGIRLRRGAELLESIEKFCIEKDIKAGVLLSGEMEGYAYDVEFDEETGYDELIMTETK